MSNLFADKIKDRDQIQKVWQACFTDSEKVIDHYIKYRMDEQTMLVHREEGQMVAMASFLPVSYKRNGKRIEARYVYAVGTLPEYRGRGYAEKIIRRAMEYFHMPLILIPATEKLTKYYEKMGFQKAFQEKKLQYETSSLGTENYIIEDITAEEYLRKRNEKWKKDGDIYWDERSVQFAMDLYSFYGGRAIKVRKKQGMREDIFLYGKIKDKLYVMESTLEDEELGEFMPQIMRRLGAKTAEYNLPGGMVWLPDGQAEELRILKNGYLNLHLN